jgi:anti-sigma regulatory factor (Ser/Thr protein kinase)
VADDPLRAARSFGADRFAPRAAAAWFRDSAASIGVAVERRADAELCLDELVTNVVRHGGVGARPLTVTVALVGEPGALVVVVEDDGPPFDPRQVPLPRFASSLEEAPLGGRGVFLVRSISDELRYERRDGRNRVTVVFRKVKPSP